MKRHLRLYSIVLTAFLLVGIMAAAAAAAAPTLTADPTSVTVTIGGSAQTVTLTRSSGSGTVNFTSSNTSLFTVSPTSFAFSSSNSTTQITITPASTGSAGSGTVTLGDASGVTSINVTVNASSGGGGSTSTEAIQPSLGGSPTAIEWGKVWSFQATDSSQSEGTWSLADDYSEAVIEAAGLEFQVATHKIVNADDEEDPWKPQAAAWDALYNAINKTTGGKWNGAQMTAKIKIKKVDENAANSNEGTKGVAVKEYTLTFKKVDITITADGTAAAPTTATGKYNTNIEDITLVATGPGTISWDVDAINAALPKGLEAEESFTAATFKNTLTISGKPMTTCKNYSVSLPASNTGSNTGAKTPKIAFTITTDAVTISVVDPEGEDLDDVLPQGNHKLNEELASSITIRAVPGPIDWTETLSTKTGLTWTVSTDTEYVTISGKFATASTGTAATDTAYTITAKNKYQTTITKETGNNAMVWQAPAFDQSYIFLDPNAKTNKKAKKDYFVTGEAFETEIPMSNFPDATSWDVTIKDAVTTEGTPVLTWEEGATEYTQDYFYTTDTANNQSETGITATVKDGKLYLVGSLDRVPKGGKITVEVKARNFATEGETTPYVQKAFTVYASGTAPTLAKKQDISFSGYGLATSVDIAVTAGDPTVTMTAVIDEKTAKKVFGATKAIDLLDETNGLAYGIVINQDSIDQGILKIYMPSKDETADSNSSNYKGYAFKKLPITVTALNKDIATDIYGKTVKTASSKITLTYAGTDPFWGVDNDEHAEALNAIGLSITSGDGEAALAKKEILYVPQNEDLGDKFVFTAEGSGPFTVTVKPEEKNGIKAKVALNSDTGKYEVTFTGKPSTETKDVSTSFTLTSKNTSTGKSAKASITFYAAPTIAVESKTITNKDKPATYGKKVKLAPKITSNSKRIAWVIDEVNGSTESADLENVYGITLDTKGKGVLSGTAKAATGMENPLVVKMHAETRNADGTVITTTDEDPVTATIYIVGEKPKLTTKKITVTLPDEGSSEIDYGDNIVFKDLSSLENTGDSLEANKRRANMTVGDTYSATPAENTFVANLNAGTAVKGLELGLPDDVTTLNTFKLSGTPASATKKEAVDVAMNNWGTVATGKITITVTGAKPVIADVSESTFKPGDSGKTIQLSVSNADSLSSNLKWKISSKPSSGATAKIDGKTGKVTFSVKEKYTSESANFSVTVTDGDSKKTSDAKDVVVNITQPTTTDSETPDLVADSGEKAVNEKESVALGEGEVHMGKERTVGALSAAQRAFFAENGYIVAAVLPEIEVTDASGQYAFEVDELEEAAATGAELVWFAFANKPTTDDDIVTFSDADTADETTVIPASRKLIVEPWLNVGTKYAPVIAVKAAAGEAEATTEEDVKAKAEEKAEEAEDGEEKSETAPELKLKEEVKDAE